MTDGKFIIETLGEAKIPTPLQLADELNLVDDDDRLLAQPFLAETQEAVSQGLSLEGFELAGPRRRLYFDPARTRAAIVTCGGLCPGINAVVRAITLQLWHRYGCREVLGIRNGYPGLGHGGEPPLLLSPDVVTDIHMKGGTTLGSARGAPPPAEMVDTLLRLGVNILFTIGGDGTMRGAQAIWDEIKRRQLKIAVVSVPKTIDNDIPFVRRSFGFETAVAIASQAVHAAHIEATGSPRGVGLVKLMGRHAGYIAANTVLATGHANFCLIPEVPFALEGKDGLLARIERRISERRHAVIVVAEGAGQEYFREQAEKRDASGNVKLHDVGTYLRDKLNQYFAERSISVAVKYIDPSYMIRAAPAHPFDMLHCVRFAQNAVHAAMAGKSGMLIGYWHGHMTHVPLQALEGREQRISPQGELWFNVLEMTGQPPRIS